MASEEDHALYDEDSEDEEDQTLNLINPEEDDDEDDDEDVDDVDEDETSGEVTVAVAGIGVINGDPTPVLLRDSAPEPKRQKVEEMALVVHEEKKPTPLLDESRRLFQRLWTDEDEIELLQGFLDYTNQRGPQSSTHHHDTTAFYDQIKSRLQLDCNKNQLVEKLRRLKKKYRNVVNRISSGKEFVFKSSHDQATFEISRKIWNDGIAGAAAAVAVAGLEDDDSHPNPNLNNNDHHYHHQHHQHLQHHQINNHFDVNVAATEKKATPRSRKRTKPDEKPPTPLPPAVNNQSTPTRTPPQPPPPQMPSLIEETVRSCLSPLFKELINNAVNGPCARGFGLNTLPLSFGGSFSIGENVDEKWRKQQILELEVYSKRLELVQDQIKFALEELRSSSSGS